MNHETFCYTQSNPFRAPLVMYLFSRSSFYNVFFPDVFRTEHEDATALFEQVIRCHVISSSYPWLFAWCLHVWTFSTDFQAFPGPSREMRTIHPRFGGMIWVSQRVASQCKTHGLISPSIPAGQVQHLIN